MIRLRSPLTAVRAGVAALTIAAGLAVALSPAHAGLRDKIKSAAGKATGGAGQKPAENAARPGAPPEFDDRTLELTDARLDQVLKGLNASASVMADRPALVARKERLHGELQELESKHGDKIGEYSSQRDAARQCLTEGVEEGRKKRFEAMFQKGMADPNSLRHIAELTVRLNEAQMKGDSAGIRKGQAEMDRINAPTREDTLHARKQCGPAPAPFAPAIRFEAAQAAFGAVFERIRALDYKALEMRTEASGLTEDQMAIAIDRAILYLAAVKQGETPSGFTDTELQALAAHKDALATAIGV